MVKMVTFIVCIFYHNEKKLTRDAFSLPSPAHLPARPGLNQRGLSSGLGRDSEDRLCSFACHSWPQEHTRLLGREPHEQSKRVLSPLWRNRRQAAPAHSWQLTLPFLPGVLPTGAPALSRQRLASLPSAHPAPGTQQMLMEDSPVLVLGPPSREYLPNTTACLASLSPRVPPRLLGGQGATNLKSWRG